LTLRDQFKSFLNEVDGFLCSFKEISTLKDNITLNHPYEAIPFSAYLLTDEYFYISPKKIITIGNNWDPLRKSEKYKDFFRLLDRDNIISVYGPERSWNFIQKSWKGYLEPGSYEISQAVKDHGISLILHSQMHINNGLITTRVLEAASCGSVIISDRNPAVIKHFGNNILYFDHTASADEIYKQIRAHYDWILSHPEEAKKMTEANHEVFLKKFTAEKGIIDVAKMHEYILAKERKEA